MWWQSFYELISAYSLSNTHKNRGNFKRRLSIASLFRDGRVEKSHNSYKWLFHSKKPKLQQQLLLLPKPLKYVLTCFRPIERSHSQAKKEIQLILPQHSKLLHWLEIRLDHKTSSHQCRFLIKQINSLHLTGTSKQSIALRYRSIIVAGLIFRRPILLRKMNLELTVNQLQRIRVENNQELVKNPPGNKLLP